MKNLYAKIFLFLFLHSSNFLNAQTFQRQTIPFKINGTTLQNPLTGGFNAPQFSSIDLNNDGKNDLYIFDRIGEVHLPFLNTGDISEAKYKFAPNYINQFPSAQNWVQLRDFNGDNIVDFFAHSGDESVDGIKVYKGYYQNNQIAFERVEFENDYPFEVLTYPIDNGLLTQIPIDGEDYPNINDVDGDGDLDVLNFKGGYVQFYENQSVEMGLSLDDLVFELKDECWGRFFESANSSAIKLSTDIDMCAPPLLGNDPEKVAHPGSTLLTFDEDGDGDVEILIGDSGNPFLTRLLNGGDNNVAYMTEQDPNFPSYDMTAFVPFFPVSFYLDVNNDGKNDLMISPNSSNFAEDTQVAWFYENTGTLNAPVFEFQQTDFLIEGMLDFGTNAYPTFADVTGDGLLDLVVGNQTFYVTGGAKDSRLFLYENIGSEANPEFELIDDNWLDFRQFNASTRNFIPTFGDLDNDGDLDLLVGESFGSLFFAENEGSVGSPMIFNQISPFWMDINIGQSAAPQIADMNRDGLPDLIIGEKQGNLNYFQNQGTSTTPIFNPDPTIAPNNSNFGGIDLGLVGSTTPVILDFEDEFKMVIGSEMGNLFLFDNIENNLDGSFNQVFEDYGKIREGAQTSPAIADINNDGILDILIGNRRGGLSLYKSNLTVDGVTTVSVELPTVFINVYPNPTQSKLNIELPRDETPELIQVFDTFGKLILEKKRNLNCLNIGDFQPGIYLLKILESGRFYRSKFVKI